MFSARPVRVHPAVLGAATAGLLLLGYFVADAPAAQAQSVLTQEFGRLKAPPMAVLVESKSGHKPGQARVGAEYRVDLGYADVRSFYDAELQRNGWQFAADEATTDWGKNVGGHLACYRRGDYWAILQYLGDYIGVPPTYGIDLTWGSSICLSTQN
jgi:hypothetical protein